MKQVKRVQTLYSFKQKDGSLLPRGIYSVDAPRGIPKIVLDEAERGATTVVVLEWGADEIKEPKSEEPKEETPKETEVEEKEEPKTEKIIRKRKQ